MLLRRLAQLTGLLKPRPEVGQPYGWERITAGGALLDVLDPGWWHADAVPSVDLDALNMADWDMCLLAQRFAPARWARQRVAASPYQIGLLALGVPFNAAPDYGFAGVDVDVLTPGWRQYIAARRVDPNSVPTNPFAEWWSLCPQC